MSPVKAPYLHCSLDAVSPVGSSREDGLKRCSQSPLRPAKNPHHPPVLSLLLGPWGFHLPAQGP